MAGALEKNSRTTSATYAKAVTLARIKELIPVYTNNWGPYESRDLMVSTAEDPAEFFLQALKDSTVSDVRKGQFASLLVRAGIDVTAEGLEETTPRFLVRKVENISVKTLKNLEKLLSKLNKPVMRAV